MRKSRAIVILGVLMWVSAPLIARAQITAVSPETTPGIACQLNTIRISGTGTCKTFTFELGDSTPIVHLPGTFPIRVYHTYTRAGTYALRAQGQGNCTGAATASLQVIGPVITSTVPSSITPAAIVLIKGQNFGHLPGQITIKFQDQLLPIQLQNVTLSDTFAFGTVPANISGEADQIVGLSVVSNCGAASAAFDVPFTAKRDLAALPFDQINCSSTAALGNTDACQSNGSYNLHPECANGVPTFGTQPGATGFQGFHASGWGLSGESGNDQFFGPTLKNGWGFDSASGLSGHSTGNFYRPNYWYTSPVGGTETNVSVNWQTDNCAYIFYWANIYISGPIGVPYQ
jgi:hypothetical protein